ncbi:NUDIX domain-containing protein [Sinosporangium album]|uniref:NUDIX domain-containing protein n=1 Tax=Sinosporangium album TaxID=504805 RepID=UPI000B8104A7
MIRGPGPSRWSRFHTRTSSASHAKALAFHAGAIACGCSQHIAAAGSTGVVEPAETFRPHVGVHLTLIQDGKVLLLLRANTGFADGSWSVPGGCVDAGETLPEGAAREAREELGAWQGPIQRPCLQRRSV